MKYIAIILIAVLLVLLVLFVSWFLNMKANGKCPICALKKIFIPTSLTIDISEEEDYSNEVAKTPPMGWSSWNTFRNNIDQDIIMQTAHAMKDSGLANAGCRAPPDRRSQWVGGGWGLCSCAAQAYAKRRAWCERDLPHAILAGCMRAMP